MTKVAPKNKENQLKPRPPYKADHHTLILSADEAVALMQILSFAKNVFAEMASNLHKENNAKDAEVMSARSSLSDILFSKIRSVASMGEPESRELH